MTPGRGRPRGLAVTPYPRRTGPTMVAVLAAVDGLDESEACTIRQLVDIIYGGFTTGRQRSVTRVVRNLTALGLVCTGYRMTDHPPDPHGRPDTRADAVQKPFPALFVWSADLEPAQRIKEPPDDELRADEPSEGGRELEDDKSEAVANLCIHVLGRKIRRLAKRKPEPDLLGADIPQLHTALATRHKDFIQVGGRV